jgi:hypothetical protein
MSHPSEATRSGLLAAIIHHRNAARTQAQQARVPLAPTAQAAAERAADEEYRAAYEALPK